MSLDQCWNNVASAGRPAAVLCVKWTFKLKQCKRKLSLFLVFVSVTEQLLVKLVILEVIEPVFSG